ncbi:MAG: hypothetical protein R2799_01270 [Crocinitomicaceae bacterium]
MKFLQIFSIVLFLSGCSTDDGKELAREYCKCISSAKGDVLLIGECEEDFKDEIKAIEKQPRVYKNFMDELENCQ